MAERKRRVVTQIDGKTPVKERYFQRDEATEKVLPVSPMVTARVSPERPKTSRGCSLPSPEKFTGL